MFNMYELLEPLKLSNKFDISKFENMNNMFSGCKSLLTLDLSSFKTSSLKRCERMFEGCNQLESIRLSIFTSSSLSPFSIMIFIFSRVL